MTELYTKAVMLLGHLLMVLQETNTFRYHLLRQTSITQDNYRISIMVERKSSTESWEKIDENTD